MAALNRTRIIAEWQRSRDALQSALILSQAGLAADAVSRAYYAVLHATKAALLTQHITPTNHQGARDLLNRYLVYQGNIERPWLDTFQNAMQGRLEADYNPLAHFDDRKAEDAYRNAAAFCDRIHRHLLEEGFTDAELTDNQP